MSKERFNYQIVFKVTDVDRIIFAGTTSFELTKILDVCSSRVVVDDAYIENVIYQPFKNVQDETKKNS